MSDTYQAVYDAIYQEYVQTISLQAEPCFLFRPSLSIDGNKWCALYGENLQDGVAGFGGSPHEAMQDFNRRWYASLEDKG